MDAKFFSSIYEGDSANGMLLGMGLTGGDFWPRVKGCQNLYRGVLPGNVDNCHLIDIADIGVSSIALNDTIEHAPSAKYLYVLRRANHCGQEEKSSAAVKVVGFDSEGSLLPFKSNNVSSPNAKQVGRNTIKLSWEYCSVNQQVKCGGFDVYYDRGTGVVDYSQPIASVVYYGAGMYQVLIEVSSAIEYRFVVRSKSVKGVSDGNNNTVTIQVSETVPEPNIMIGAILI